MTTAREEVATLIEKARKAQKEYEEFSQEQVDEIVRAIGKLVYDRAEELSEIAVAESKMASTKTKSRNAVVKPASSGTV